MATLSDIPREHRVFLASRARDAASQLSTLASVLDADEPTMPIGTAYDGLCVANRALDSLAVDIAGYGPGH